MTSPTDRWKPRGAGLSTWTPTLDAREQGRKTAAGFSPPLSPRRNRRQQAQVSDGCSFRVFEPRFKPQFFITVLGRLEYRASGTAHLPCTWTPGAADFPAREPPVFRNRKASGSTMPGATNTIKISGAPSGESLAVGIDLGTTYSCVGVWQNGRVEIIANDQVSANSASNPAFKGGKGRRFGISHRGRGF